MKKFKTGLILITLSCFITFNASAQATIKNYDKEWKNVEALIKKNLPKSALTEVKKIYDLAKKEKQDAQVIKSLFYMSNLQDETREDNEILSIKEMEKELAGSREPVTSLLNSLLAMDYWYYFQSRRWTLYNRTQTVNFNKEDIDTWSAEDFYKKASELFLKSIANQKLLQQTRLEPFNAIIIKGNVRHLRPTLFDLLSHRALSFFENDERDLNKPAYAFEIDQASAFDPADDFITRKFTTSDSSSLYHKALLIYQQLIAFHLADAKPDALIDADIQRLEFINNKSTHPDKEQLYFNAINHIAHQYERVPAASQAWYLLAVYYENKAQQYKPYGDSTHRMDRVKAKDICEKVVAQKDSSEGKINCYNLLQQINTQSLQFNIEKVNVTGQPFRALVEYRNFNTIYFRLIKPDEKLSGELINIYEDKYWQSLLSAPVQKSWQQALPTTNDLQEHKAEVKIDALPAGEYMLIASTNKDFTSKTAILGARVFYVSNISFVNSYDDFFVMNRESGQPLAGAAVQIWTQRYDYPTAKYVKEKSRLYKTDANGFFRRDPEKAENRYNNSFQLDINFNGERFFMNDLINNQYYYRDNSAEPKQSTSIFLFIDRSIYRPGQTLYFKGITLTKNSSTNKADALPNYQTVVYLRDANQQLVDSANLITNEFGSFSGTFHLPQSGLTGQYSLYTKKDNGNASFRVEEYKRPKFFVEYEPIKGVYTVNDKIKVTVTAKAYAGNNIDGAMIKYRVIRQPRFLYPWMFKRWWQPPAEPMEIAHGEAKTDANGKYVIEFTAIPDLKIDRKFDPSFDYTVYADITDINGETRSGEKMVTVSYKSLFLTTTIPPVIAVDSLKTFRIRTQNMNGEFEPATVKVIISKINEEKRLIRQRYWDRPDQFIMTKEEYTRNFPYDEYNNESDYTSWEKGEKIFEKTDSAKASGEFTVQNTGFKPGFYIVEISTKDKKGEEVKDVKYIELYDEKNNQLVKSQYLWFVDADPIEPGETATAKIGSSAENLFVVQQVDRSSGSGSLRDISGTPPNASYSFIRLNNEKKEIPFTATETDRGGFGVYWIFIKHNRVYQRSQVITVPWTNKKLMIEYATYRDKTLPGSEEKWKLRITGYKNEKAAAEVLASMYDASLDQFYPHAWTEPGIWTSYMYPRYWNGNSNFINITSNNKQWSYPQVKELRKEYDYLFGTEFPRQIMRGRSWKEGGDFYGVAGAPVAQMLEGKAAGIQVSRKVAGDDMEIMAGVGAFSKADSRNETDKFDNTGVQVRKNFNETAFFFPDLRTDSSGAIEFSFTLPDALTRWKFQALAHTKDLAFGYSSKEIITQKQLMAQPNAPRFLREGDKMEFSSKVVNLSDKELKGQAEFQLLDATTNQPVDKLFKNSATTQSITIAAGQSVSVKFPIEIPGQFNKALLWRIVVRAGEFSDGEENAMPVLTNRMLVTETLPLNMKGTGTKNFSFDKLVKSGASTTLQTHSLTVEYTSNPVWYAIQALPYLMEYPYDCAEQTWNRYYANSLASFIANSSPKIKAVFEQWSKIPAGDVSSALLSNLQKNEELKSVLLEETPWVLQAKTEAEQKKNIALLFDMIRMGNELDGSFEKLKQMQSSNGGFVWFKGGPDDRYITQYIVSGIGHLRKLNGIVAKQDANIKQILALAIPYLDRKIKEDYDNLIKYKTDLKKYMPDYSEVHYLYMRSFFPEYKIPAASQTAYTYFRTRLPLNWTTQNKYMQGMIALTLSRAGDTKTPAAILASLKETSIVNEELGMYWKDAQRGWWWYEAPIERQALLIEAFQEIAKDTKTVDNLRTWLLKNKQTNNWESTKATAEACYALLLQGTKFLENQPNVSIRLGDTVIQSVEQSQQAGTGYFKKSIEGEKVTPSMGNISVTTTVATGGQENLPTWGAVYWQYFENLDKITPASTPLSLSKKLFIETNTDRGPVLTPVTENSRLKVGDKIKVRIELRVDREMEYVHMKDMRASCLEPVNVLSSYKWQGGLGYYESTKDASTNFFFNNLRRGTYVFEYPLFVTHSGNFSNGITSIQCMYAPEFSSHSEGIRISVE